MNPRFAGACFRRRQGFGGQVQAVLMKLVHQAAVGAVRVARCFSPRSPLAGRAEAPRYRRRHFQLAAQASARAITRKQVPAGLLLAGILLCGALQAAADLAARVIVVANARQPESVALARFYAAQRAIPEANIIALSMPETETVTWREFVDQVFQPLQDELIEREWISAIPSSLLDGFGRRRGTFTGHRISYLVTCRGVPLRIHHDPTVEEKRVPALAGSQFETNQAAVDSELGLLAQGNPPGAGFVPNPLYARDRPASFEAEMVVKVSRLDGPAWEDARRLVLSALEGERQGLAGRYYVDLKGPHADGDEWLDSVRTQLDELGFDGSIENTGGTFPADARFEAPVLYFGWYVGSLNGPFRREGFRFPPGAVAMHIHSYSAATLHSPDNGWSGPLVARGAAATVGNVFEPYLQFTHRPHLLLRALARGRNFGDAASYALPVFSWQAIALGDPLYQPFAVGLEEQEKSIDTLPPALAPYVAIRRAKLHLRRERPAEAEAVLQAAMERMPGLALTLALSRAHDAAGDRAKAVATLEVALPLRDFRGEHWPQGREIARELAALGASAPALQLYAVLAKSIPPAPEALHALLAEARTLADQSGDLARSIEFARLLNEASAPPPK